jgi:cytoskeletal protein CcmA (bactofilin family)
MKNVVILLLITILLTLTGCDNNEPTQSLSGPATKLPKSPPPETKPPDKPTSATTSKVADNTSKPAPVAHDSKPAAPLSPVAKPPEAASDSKLVAKAEKPVAPTTPPANQPILLSGERKTPRIDVIGREGTQLSINLYFDNQLLCTISGKIDAKQHRPFQGELLAEGVCYSEKIISQGTHEYQLLGRLTLPDGTQHDVSFTTGSRNVTDVVQPSVEIHQGGKIEIKLAVG